MYAGGNGLSDGRGKSVKSIQEEDVGSEWIDGTIRRILAAQVFITVLFFLLLFLLPDGVRWWGVIYGILECIIVFRGFFWLSGCVNKSLRLACDCAQSLIDGHWGESRTEIILIPMRIRSPESFRRRSISCMES